MSARSMIAMRVMRYPQLGFKFARARLASARRSREPASSCAGRGREGARRSVGLSLEGRTRISLSAEARGLAAKSSRDLLRFCDIGHSPRRGNKTMLIEHAGKRPTIDPMAWVAPDATLCGDVTIGPGVRILHGARLVGEAGGAIPIGRDGIVMENAVIRASTKHPCTIGDHRLIGPNAHVTGATLEDEVFVATGAAIFHGAVVGRGSEVRVHATVHLRTRLEPGAMVPIGWVAVGDPARILPPDRHDEIWEVQRSLNFPEWVYGFDRSTPDLMRRGTRRLSEALAAHAGDAVIDG